MTKIAVLIDDMFEDSEYGEPANAFRDARHDLVHLGLTKRVVKGVKKGTEVRIDKTFDDVSPADFDAVFIPGGYSPDQLRADERPVNFIREFVKSGRPVFFICHGAQLLITADVLKGRKVTGWKSIVQDIKNAGAQYLDQEVVEDGNFVSSRFPADIPAFIKTCLQKLRG